jgi:hypothetical protein
VTFSWETDTSALKWKYLYRYSANDDEFHCFDSTTGTSFIDKPVNYYANSYCLLIKTSIGDSIFSNIITGSKLIPAPTGLKATGTADGVYLEWNSLPGIGTYHICRSDSASDSTYFYQETSDTFYFDLEATSLRYRYQIEADNDWMIGKRSDPVICGVVPSASAKRRLSSGK